MPPDTKANPPPEPLWPPGHPVAACRPGGEAATYRRYLLPAGRPTACVIVLPGGGYSMKAPHEAEPVAHWLNHIGIAAVVVYYRTLPDRHPAPFLDATRAVRLVRARAANWNLRPDRIGLLGFSAGGHLAATVGTRFEPGNPAALDPVDQVGSRPDALVLCYPVITSGRPTHAESIANLMGEDPGDAVQLKAWLANERHVTRKTPPTFLWHTADDEAVPVRNSLLFAAALARRGVPFELHVFPHGAHGLGLAEGDPVAGQWTRLCASWLRTQGFTEAP